MPDIQNKCKQCGQVLSSPEALREHEKTHKTEQTGSGQHQSSGGSGYQGGGQTRGAGGGTPGQH